MRRARGLIVAALALLLAQPAAGQDLDAGRAAYARGDYAAALHEWQPLAEHGSSEAQYELGRLYAYGIGVERNFKTSRAWYEKAARQGDGRAAYEVGVYYELGRGVFQDERKAAYWFREGAKAGHAPSQEKLTRYAGFLR